MAEGDHTVIVKYVDAETGKPVPRDKIEEKVKELAPKYAPDQVPDYGPDDEWDPDDLAERYGVCGARRFNKKTPCLKRAGHGTDHTGFGRCKKHGGGGELSHGRYSQLRSNISEKIARHREDKNPLDITDEVAAMRALFEEFIENWTEIKEALIAWNEAEREEVGRGARPRKLPKLTEGFEMLRSLSRIAQRQQRIEMEDAISRRELRRVLQEFARVVEQEIPKDIPEDLDGDDLIRRIKDGWNSIHIY